MPDAPEERDRQGSDEDLGSHPGRPRRRDELDPELLKLPRKGIRIGWLLALSVVVFCTFLMIELRRDLAYSREGDDPTALESVEQVRDADLNTYVEIDAVPDRGHL